MDENVVKKLIYNYLRLWRNLEFQVEKIESKGIKFEASVTAPGRNIPDRILAVDKHTGWIQMLPGSE